MKRKLVMFLSLFFLGIGIITAQIQVRGIVVDEAGEPVIGATIQLKGTTQGTVTDLDGNFTLSAPAGGTLTISYVGMQTKDVPVSANVKVVLNADTQMLDEVLIVGAMGIARPPRSAGFGQSVVDPSEAIQKPSLIYSFMDEKSGCSGGASSATAGSALSAVRETHLFGEYDPLYVWMCP